MNVSKAFNTNEVLHDLKHFLPAQAPLKDFIHHNTLHAFQQKKFFDALRDASEIFGYKVSLTLDEYRHRYHTGEIRHDILEKVVREKKGADAVTAWTEKLLHYTTDPATSPRIGTLRSHWKKQYHVDLDALVHPILFRVVCSYLDQGISIWNFPVSDLGFLASLRELETQGYSSLFRTRAGRELFLRTDVTLEGMLERVVGEKALYKQYLYDQQFAHQGWSGMVSAIEDQPHTLLDPRKISLHELIHFELALEIDALEAFFAKGWQPLARTLTERPADLFGAVPETELHQVMALWQEAFEWSYYDQVLSGIEKAKHPPESSGPKKFQAMFCIDDRECSLRRYIEKLEPAGETFATPGFFGVEFFYQPEDGKFYTKLCPAPVTPQYLIKEIGPRKKREKDAHFSKHSHSFYGGWLITQTLGFWSAFKLFLNIFRPSMSPATATSFRHMDKFSRLTIENRHPEDRENDLQIGFTVDEMAIRVENLLKSIGLVKDFAPLVYVVGHGSSSVNNPHYAAYDCGACSGRAGSVNARVICAMANHPQVREKLAAKGLVIPPTTQFVGGLHDTTRDDMVFFDENSLSAVNLENHEQYEAMFARALDLNAKERSRRFESINTRLRPARIHEKIRERSVSLFEPRPELNHATNALCVVGRRELTKGLFLDRRSFMNSFDYRVDPDGKYLLNILRAAAPVCGGINLEYFFSRVDNQKLGAGTKLPHNVMGLFGVANGIDGDLRPGLPSQMIEVHDPVRLMIIVEHFPEVVLATLLRSPETYQWFDQQWIHLVAVHPETQRLSVFKEGAFHPYKPLKDAVDRIDDITPVLESHHENIPVYAIA